MSNSYFVISHGRIEKMCKQQLLEHFVEICDPDLVTEPMHFLETLIEDGWTGDWPDDVELIIKGKIVTPKPKEVVKVYDID